MTKNVLITGASRGIGRAIALSFASAGYHLYLTCKHQFHLLKELKKEIIVLHQNVLLSQTQIKYCCSFISEKEDDSR